MIDGIEDRIREILAKVADYTGNNRDIGLEDDLVKLGLNSISFIKIVVALEREFDIQFEEENLDFDKMRSLGSMITYVEQKITE